MSHRLLALAVLAAVFTATPALATGPIIPEASTVSLLGAAAVAGILIKRLRSRG